LVVGSVEWFLLARACKMKIWDGDKENEEWVGRWAIGREA
jgi:hypothetical protein